jgi:hypothetical protein
VVSILVYMAYMEWTAQCCIVVMLLFYTSLPCTLKFALVLHFVPVSKPLVVLSIIRCSYISQIAFLSNKLYTLYSCLY